MLSGRYDETAVHHEGAGIVREVRTNERIRARELLVIGENGERLGVLPLAEALAAAREQDLDLVEVAPSAVPPVCRLLDYGKYKYEQAKRERSAGKQQHHGELREVRFKVKIGEHDMDLKVRRAERFLRDGDKVKLSVMFRGRENAHPEIGRSLLQRVQEQLQEVAVVEKPPTMEGRFMNMILGPVAARQQRQQREPAPSADAKVASEG